MLPARKITIGDAFAVAKAINAAEISMETINDLFDVKKLKGSEDEQVKAGINLFTFIIQKAPALENPLYELLAGISGKTPDDIKNAAFIDICELVKAIIEQSKDIKDFFMSALKSAIR